MSNACLLKGLNIIELWNIIDSSETATYFAEPIIEKTIQQKHKSTGKDQVNFLNFQSTKTVYWITFIDFIRQYVLPSYTDKPCWWHRESFACHPIGCPIEYHNFKNQPLMSEYIKNNLKESNITFGEHEVEFFETEGIFCSLSCVKAWILNELPKNPIKYQKCLGLLSVLAIKLNKKDKNIITCAPSWKLLDKWGGHLNNDDYIDGIEKNMFCDTPNIKRPMMFPVGEIFELFIK